MRCTDVPRPYRPVAVYSRLRFSSLPFTDPALGSDIRYAPATLLNSPKPDVSVSVALAARLSGVCLVYRLFGRARDSSYCPMPWNCAMHSLPAGSRIMPLFRSSSCISVVDRARSLAPFLPSFYFSTWRAQTADGLQIDQVDTVSGSGGCLVVHCRIDAQVCMFESHSSAGSRAFLRAILQRGSSIASTGMRIRAVIAAWAWWRVLGVAAGLH